MNGFGLLGLASWILANPIVLHKHCYITSIVIQFMPMCMMYNLTEITMPLEEGMDEKDRVFCSFPKDELFFSKESFYYNFVAPFSLYIVWAILWFLFVRVFLGYLLNLKTIGYYDLYDYLAMSEPWAVLPRKFGSFGVFISMFVFFCLYSVGYILAIVAFNYPVVRPWYIIVYTILGLLRGSNYYDQVLQFAKHLRVQGMVRSLH